MNNKKYCYFSVCNNEYVPHFLTMITSLADVERELPVFLVQTELTQENLDIIENHARLIGIDLTILGNPGVDLSVFAPCGNYPEVVWLKFYIEELFPKQFERILFIDPDIIILRELKSIFEIDMKSKPMASVIDMLDNNDGFKRSIGIPNTGKYFNTGLILYDRKKYKELQISSKSAEFAKSHPDKIVFVDQCVFNAVAWREFLELDKKWNLMVGFRQGRPERTNVIHFAAMKPWEDFNTPGIELYIHFRNKTPIPLNIINKSMFTYIRSIDPETLS